MGDIAKRPHGIHLGSFYPSEISTKRAPRTGNRDIPSVWLGIGSGRIRRIAASSRVLCVGNLTKPVEVVPLIKQVIKKVGGGNASALEE